jgi:hypothetical protein
MKQHGVVDAKLLVLESSLSEEEFVIHYIRGWAGSGVGEGKGKVTS